MEKLLVHPAYFGSIHQFAAMSQAAEWLIEEQDNYQKQTYRTRQYIYGANGRLSLTIPIQHSRGKKARQQYKEVKIENQFAWQINHWRSLQTAYRTSPFFEFYEDEIRPLYEKRFTFLMDFNYACWEVVNECLQLEKPRTTTTDFQLPGETPTSVTDARILIEAKKEIPFEQESYTQVFDEKFGFIKNLSILDLLFNEGSNALHYLESQALQLR